MLAHSFTCSGLMCRSAASPRRVKAVPMVWGPVFFSFNSSLARSKLSRDLRSVFSNSASTNWPPKSSVPSTLLASLGDCRPEKISVRACCKTSRKPISPLPMWRLSTLPEGVLSAAAATLPFHLPAFCSRLISQGVKACPCMKKVSFQFPANPVSAAGRLLAMTSSSPTEHSHAARLMMVLSCVRPAVTCAAVFGLLYGRGRSVTAAGQGRGHVFLDHHAAGLQADHLVGKP